MTLFTMENVTESLRGECTRFLLEVRAGVFLGAISATVRDLLWEKICSNCCNGGAVMAYSFPNEQGYVLKMCGDPKRQVVDFDGISLIQIKK